MSGPVIASFDAETNKGVAAYLRKAARAIDPADPTIMALALLSGAVLDWLLCIANRRQFGPASPTVRFMIGCLPEDRR